MALGVCSAVGLGVGAFAYPLRSSIRSSSGNVKGMLGGHCCCAVIQTHDLLPHQFPNPLFCLLSPAASTSFLPSAVGVFYAVFGGSLSCSILSSVAGRGGTRGSCPRKMSVASAGGAAGCLERCLPG